MNKRLLLLALACMNAYAEPESLPPIEDNSSYYGGANIPNHAGSMSNGGAVSYNGRSANPANGMYQVLGQMEQLQKEMRQLGGTVEEQAHELAELKKRQASLLDDMEQRVQNLEKSKSAPEAAVEVPAATPAAVIPAAPVDAPVNASAQPVQPEAKPYVSDVAPSTPVATDTTEKFPKQIYPPPKPVTPPAPVAKTGEKEQYQSAYDTLRDGHYSKAIAGFNALLTNYPTGEYASNAQYWLGETYKVSQDIPAARDAFNKVISNYPTSPKVPDSLLKLGFIELEQNNVAKAKEYLNKVSTSYPNTTAANLAAKKLAALSGGAPQ